MYDMVGCGQSPVTPDWDAYRKTEHMQDLQAIVRRGRDVLPRNKKTSISTILVSHSYGPSIVLSWLASLQRQQQQQQPQDQEVAASNHNDGDYNIQGLVFLSTSLRDDNLPHPDGGAWPFRYLPMSVLHCLNATMTRDFCHRAVHGKHSTLKRAMLEAGPRNDMVMVQAFHRQAIWATRDDLQTALQVLTRQFSNSSSSTSSSSLSGSSTSRNKDTIRCLVVHGADDGIIDIQQGQKLVNLLQEHHQDSFLDDDAKLIVIPEASHMIMLEQPTLVARAIVAYLQELR